MTKVLAGVQVVELGTFITGPYAGMLLADLGAEVIKVEQPGTGDPFRSYRGTLYSPQFCAYNAGKRSLTLNLKSALSRDVLLRLSEKADVLIENYRPGVLDKLGFGWARLHDLNPRLVYCSISGFGSDGPYAERACYDTVAQAMSGYLSQFTDDRDPQIRGPAVADAISGLYAAYGVLGALVERGRTGFGRRVEIAMLDALVAFSAEPFANYFGTGVPPSPQMRPSISQSFALVCSDGKLVVLHLGSLEKFWEALVATVDRPELGSDPRFMRRDARIANYKALASELDAVFRSRPRGEWLARLECHDVPHAPIATLDEVVADPHVRYRGLFRVLAHASQGNVMNVRPPVLYDGERDGTSRPPPTLGEHNVEILTELGYDSEAVARMSDAGAF